MKKQQTYKVVLKDENQERMLLVEGNINSIKDSETISKIVELVKIQEADRDMLVSDMKPNRKYTFILDNGLKKDLGILREHKGMYQFELKLTSPDCPVIKLEFDKDMLAKRLYDLEIVDGMVEEEEDLTIGNLLVLAITLYMGYTDKIDLEGVSDFSRIILFDVIENPLLKVEDMVDGIGYTVLAKKDSPIEYVTVQKEFDIITAILDGEDYGKKEVFTFRLNEALHVLKQLTLYSKDFTMEGKTLQDLNNLVETLFSFRDNPMFADVCKEVFVEEMEELEEEEVKTVISA
ncbi:hypothetical protein P9X10_00560 [Bacillus cereus]|nr:hypothetical protein [Bacillus cereus]